MSDLSQEIRAIPWKESRWNCDVMDTKRKIQACGNSFKDSALRM